jgi:hypothetical protein
MYALVVLNNVSCTETKDSIKIKKETNIENIDVKNKIKINKENIIYDEDSPGHIYYKKDVFADLETFYTYAKEDLLLKIEASPEYNMFSKTKKEDFQDLYERIVDNINEIEKIKSEELEKLKSLDYLNRLKIELNSTTEQAKKIQKERINRLLNTEYYISNHKNSSEEGSFGTTKTDNTNPKIYYAYDLLNENIETIRHEIQHAILGNDEKIPIKTQKKILKRFNKNNFEKSEIEYLFSPHEILARKAVFEKLLEDFGIKKYNEKFTKKHYKKIKKLMETRNTLDGNNLIIPDNNAREFFRMFEKDALIMIMNTVSYLDYIEIGVPIEQGKIAE